MRLSHASEDPDITRFCPRLPARADLDPSKGLVWAVTEDCLPNFLTPRACPRVTYHAGSHTTEDDIAKFFSGASRHCVAIEHAWHTRMLHTTLYLYEFDPARFRLQDACAGYYVSETAQMPTGQTRVDDLYGALFARSIEVRLIDTLWPLADAVKQSTLQYSICRMANAQPRNDRRTS